MDIDPLLTALTENEELLKLAWSTLPESERRELFDAVATKLLDRFEGNRSMDDLDRAITMEEQLLAFTPDDDPNRGIYLENLGWAVQSRFERMGSMDDLGRAIWANEQAVSL